MTRLPAIPDRSNLQERYDAATEALRAGLLDGQPWETLEPVRRQVTALEIALDLNAPPRQGLRIRRLRIPPLF